MSADRLAELAIVGFSVVVWADLARRWIQRSNDRRRPPASKKGNRAP